MLPAGQAFFALRAGAVCGGQLGEPCSGRLGPGLGGLDGRCAIAPCRNRISASSLRSQGTWETRNAVSARLADGHAAQWLRGTRAPHALQCDSAREWRGQGRR